MASVSTATSTMSLLVETTLLSDTTDQIVKSAELFADENDGNVCCYAGAQQEELNSDINIRLSEDVEVKTGLSLNSTSAGHFIRATVVESDPCFCPVDLGLKVNDRILAINGHLVIYWLHAAVLETFTYLLYLTQLSEKISMVIDRQDDCGNVYMYEICVVVHKTRVEEKNCVGECDIEIDLGSAYIEIKSFLKRINYIPCMRCVKFKELFQCRIRHGGETNSFLHIDDKMILGLEKLKKEDTDQWMFDCYMYHALKRCPASRRHEVSSVFICVLRSCYVFEENKRPYVFARNCEQVGAMCFKSLRLDDRRTENPDPRFFKVTSTSNGMRLFESLIYKEYYLSWDSAHGKLKLVKHNRSDMTVLQDYLTDCQFEILKN